MLRFGARDIDDLHIDLNPARKAAVDRWPCEAEPRICVGPNLSKCLGFSSLSVYALQVHAHYIGMTGTPLSTLLVS